MKAHYLFTILFVCTLAATAQQEKRPADVRLYYKGFTVMISGFKGYSVQTSGDDYDIHTLEGDTTRATLRFDADRNIIGLTVKDDTLELGENPNDQITGNLLHIIPKYNTDSFAVSYAFEQSTYEVIDHRNITREEWAKKEEHTFRYTDITGYRALQSQKKNVFKVPAFADRQYIPSLKRKYHLHDTLVVIPSEYDITARFTDKDKKLYGHWVSYIYLVY